MCYTLGLYRLFVFCTTATDCCSCHVRLIQYFPIQAKVPKVWQHTVKNVVVMVWSVVFFSRPRSEGWPHHGRTFSKYLYPLSFWLALPRRVLSTSWCCPSRPCVVFLACVHLALFLALSLSPGNSLVSSWCDHSMLASLLCFNDVDMYRAGSTVSLVEALLATGCQSAFEK